MMLGDTGKEKGKSSVYKTLQESPGSFAFGQAVALTQLLLEQQGVASPEEAIRYKVNPNLSFPPSDIDSLHFEQGEDGTKAEMTMNLMGLHGAGSPLPTYFTEYVAQHQDEIDPLRDFFDVFNHRLVSNLYDIWYKYRYYIQFEEGAEDKLSRRFFSFIGLGYDEVRQAKHLNWSSLLAYMGLIAFKGDAAGSLESTLRHYFSHQDVFIIPCIRRLVAIPLDQQCRLGENSSMLGEDMLVGEQVADQTGKFRICIADLSWERFNAFLPDGQIFSELSALVKNILRSQLEFDVEFRLRPAEIRPFTIGAGSVTRLGWSTWLGDNGDGIVTLVTGS